MSAKILTTLKVDQRLGINQQLQQAISLLQYSTIELKQICQQHLEANLLLDVDEENIKSEQEEDLNSPYQYSATLVKKGVYHSDDNELENYAKSKTLNDYLLEQTLLCHFNEVEQAIAEYIIGAIDEDGFLTMSIAELYHSLKNVIEVTEESIEKILKRIQGFDPAGVGSSNVRECLILQLLNLQNRNSVWDNAFKIINELSDYHTIGELRKSIKSLKISTQAYDDAIELIKTLNFHPGAQYFSDKNYAIEPELYVRKVNNKWRVYLFDSLFNHMKINKQYQDIIRKDRKNAAYSTLKQELEEAKWLISGLKKRNETLLLVASYIIQIQNEFLEHGQEYMKSINIVDVANALNIHESTVSRITTGKYIATPRGIFELKYFFPSHVSTETGDICSAVAVKSLIKDIIDKEDAKTVHSDSEIAIMLKDKGINIARRTVTKYRESMNLLSSYERQIHHASSGSMKHIIEREDVEEPA